MKEKICIYYDTSESFNYFNKISIIQFFNSMYVVVLTTAYKPDPFFIIRGYYFIKNKIK
jgi:hypothetical protein